MKTGKLSLAIGFHYFFLHITFSYDSKYSEILNTHELSDNYHSQDYFKIGLPWTKRVRQF